MQAGVDGFLRSPQARSLPLSAQRPFQEYVKPTDLAVWSESRRASLINLHICDYVGGYTDLNPFGLPGHVIQQPPEAGSNTIQR